MSDLIKQRDGWREYMSRQMEELVEQFGHAVKLEIIFITISPPDVNGVAILKAENAVTKEYATYAISANDCIHWYQIASDLASYGWL